MRLLGTSCLFAALALVGCGGSQGFESSGKDSGLDGGSGDGEFDGNFVEDASEAGPGRACSEDGRSVVDEFGQIVVECDARDACLDGACVPACQAAVHGSVGCDYLIATPSFYSGIKPPCLAMFIANNGSLPVQINVTWGGMSFDVTQFGRIPDGTSDVNGWTEVPGSGLPPDEVAVLFLADDPESVNGSTPLKCPIEPAIRGAGGTAVWTGNNASSGIGDAFHVTTDLPVSAYDIIPYGGADSYLPSAQLLLPTSAWGKNYIAVVPPGNGAGWGQIVAKEDGTEITVLPTVGLPGGASLPDAPANQATTYTLNAGQFLQWQDTHDMSGTVIEADKPIEFIGGNTYVCFGGGCDCTHQMVPPVSALGFEYAVAPYTPRGATPENVKYRIVGAVDGTVLSFDPPIGSAPDLVDSGQVADFSTTEAFTVRSQDENHPFYISQLMLGCTGGTSGCLGDEEWVNVFPPAQYLSKYVFFTDPTYPTTNLVVIRENDGSGFKDVEIDCVGALTNWTPIGSDGKYEMANTDLLRNGVPVNDCTNGRHVATSAAPFGLVVWGLDSYSSYGYPAGGSVTAINPVVVKPVPK